MSSAIVPDECVGCVHADKDWATHPCDVCSDAELYKSDPAAQQPEISDLEVWRQAYNAALSCSNVCNTEACDCANSALIDYRAKREEMGR